MMEGAHPSDVELLEYAEGELDETAAAGVRAHVRACEDCARELAETERARTPCTPPRRSACRTAASTRCSPRCRGRNAASEPCARSSIPGAACSWSPRRRPPRSPRW